jgi:PAS domain S-box-containing protein
MISILLVDDETGLLEIARLYLEDQRGFRVQAASSAKEALHMMQETLFDVVVSDYQMPVMDGIQFLKKLRGRKDPIPFIIFTGRGREEIVIEALNEGADFYLQKGGEPEAQFAELSHIIRKVVRQHRAEDELGESEEKYRHLIEHSNDAIVVAQDGMLKMVNRRAVELTGYSEQELLSMPFPAVIHPDDRAMVVERHQKRLKGEDLPSRYRFRLGPKDASTRWVELSVAVIDWDGRPATLNFLTDITGRKKAEDALRESQKELELTLDATTDGIWKWDFSTNLLEFSPRYYLMLGYQECEFPPTFESWLNLIHPDDRENALAVTETYLATKPDTYENKFRLRTKSGEYRWIHASARVVERDASGAALRMIGNHQDITGRKRAEEVLLKKTEELQAANEQLTASEEELRQNYDERTRQEQKLREREEWYRNVVEDQTEFICRFLPDGTHIFVNDAYCRYFDKKREEIVGHRFRPVIHPEDREKVTRHIASITPEHPVMDIDQRIIMPDGSTRWQRWSDRAIFDPNGRVIEYQSVGRDITEQKELEKEMDYRQQELRQFSTSLAAANKKLTLLSGITRHDISNQLTVLRGFLRILEKKQPDTSFSEHFQNINTAAQRISSMIQFTKEYEAIGVYASAWQDVRTLVDTAAKEAPLGQVMVKNDLPAGTEVFAGPMIVKVFYNLMDNAVRYGGKITTIRFSVEERDEDLVIVCEDDGDGVPADEKEKIFERGFGKNTGLGLFLAREILDITGITISESGEPGTGARFEMTVPEGSYRMNPDTNDVHWSNP